MSGERPANVNQQEWWLYAHLVEQLDEALKRGDLDYADTLAAEAADQYMLTLRRLATKERKANANQ